MHVLSKSHDLEVVSDYLRGQTARSLDLLREIDGTIDALVMTRQQMDSLAEMFESRRKQVLELKGPLCEQQTIPSLEQSQDSLASMHDELAAKLLAARVAPELRHDDGVVDAFESALTSVQALNAKIEEVRWAILEHNAELEDHTERLELTNGQEISAFIRSL